MPKKWFLGNGHNNFVVARRSDLYPPEVSTVDPKTFSENFDQWNADERLRETLRDLSEATRGSSSKTTGDVKSQLEELFRKGELVMLRTQPRDVLPRIKPADAPAQKPGEERSTKKKTTWIEIELVDEKNKPVPKRHYRIELADGSIEDGTLDDFGRAYLDDIEPGTCKVSFPDIDANEWQKV